MRPIDADALMACISYNAYPIKHGFKWTSDDLGMTLTGIKQAINEASTIQAPTYSSEIAECEDK